VKKRKTGVLSLVDPIEAIEALLSKWVVHVLKPRGSNLQELLRFQLRQYQPHKGGMEP
jgi:hypothetical protein